MDYRGVKAQRTFVLCMNMNYVYFMFTLITIKINASIVVGRFAMKLTKNRNTGS